MIELNKVFVTASYFGFQPIPAPRVTRRDLELTRQCGNHPHYNASEKVALIRTYLEDTSSSISYPLTLIYKKSIPTRKKHGDEYGLHLIGSTSGITEATLIRTALSILSERGFKNLRVHINCIGDKESLNSYERELINYARKFSHDLSEELRQKIKEDVFNIFKMETAEALHLSEAAPSSINFLSIQSRVHFRAPKRMCGPLVQTEERGDRA